MATTRPTGFKANKSSGKAIQRKGESQGPSTEKTMIIRKPTGLEVNKMSGKGMQRKGERQGPSTEKTVIMTKPPGFEVNKIPGKGIQVSPVIICYHVIPLFSSISIAM
ncbi:uncharacterized protein LOC119596985 [Penaeus monodon]|uniref:uncharacterized protein LOC119596985 n=1 Tax=Penaeus monodon TaxID=6687 RepID=UPI0018A6D78E|nr:uncharacterized protein LOC119596985 [Penaeus monodon]